jgi:Uma2 family endonuclease
VRCDDTGSSKDEFSIRDPKVIVEVLSPSTQRFDRGDKRLAYLQIPTLTDYVLISQDSHDVKINKTTGTLQ